MEGAKNRFQSGNDEDEEGDDVEGEDIAEAKEETKQ